MKRPECPKKCVSGHAALFPSSSGEVLGRGGTAPSTQKAAALPRSSGKEERGRRGGEQIGPGDLEAVPDGAGEAVRPSAGHRSGSAPLPDRGGCAAGLASSPYRMKAQSPGPLPP